jgi:biotin carboxyl carrier protein
LAEELRVPLYDEERQQGAVLQQAMQALWVALSGSAVRLLALSRTAVEHVQDHAEYHAVLEWMVTNAPDVSQAEATALLHELLAWLQATVPAVNALLDILESTHIHTLLTVNDDLSVTRPAFLEDETVITQLHHLLSGSLRPTMLRQGELLSPMEATIYHQPEPGTPPFVEMGEEVKVGQTLALLEAMKMFTELQSPVDGVLVAILVDNGQDNGQGVKTGTPLFRIATQDAEVTTAAEVTLQTTEAASANRFGLLLPGIEAGDV